MLSCSLEDARRLQVTKQHLSGKLPVRSTSEQMLSAVRDTCFIQWDPITAVAPSHVIAFWSRIGKFRLSDLDRLLWDERKFFLHWTPMASIVLTEDYPLYSALMRRYREPPAKTSIKYLIRARKFLADHKELRTRILNELKAGPLRLNQFKGYAPTGRAPDGWSSGSEISNMLFQLLKTGEVMVVGHEGNQNVWALTGDFPSKSAKNRELSEDEFEREAAQRALRALGIAFAREIYLYFPRDRYLALDTTLKQLEEESIIHRIKIEGITDKERFIHERDIPLLESIDDKWQPRLTLLAPFDNLLGDRARTQRLFSFDYVHENFLSESKRKFGTFVHPILWGDRIIGRADLLKDKTTGKLLVNCVHAEPGIPVDKEIGQRIAETMEDFGEFLGTTEVVYTSRVPAAWKSSLRT